MLPYIRFFGFGVASYGFMILSGLIIAAPVAVRLGNVNGFSVQDTLFASLYGVVGLILGGKLFYLFTNARWIWGNRLLIISDPDVLNTILRSGFVFYGGLFGAIYGVAHYCRKYGLSVWAACAVLAPCVPLVHTFGRIGCFLAGCCYGIEHSSILAVTFSHSPVAPNGIPLFPVQLLEAGVNMLIFIALMSISKRRARGSAVLLAYLSMYSAARFTLEFLRGDLGRGMLFGVSTSQWISIFALIGALLSLVVGRNRRKAWTSGQFEG